MVKLHRRRMLQLGVVGVSGLVGLGQSESVLAQESDAQASITIEDQESRGETITIGSVSTSVDATIRISENSPGPNETYKRVSIDAGTTREDWTVNLDTEIPESQPVIARVSVPSQDYETIANARFFVTVVGEGETDGPYGVSFIEEKPDQGFNYPYFLFTPTTEEDEKEVSLLVQPNNSGTSSDDFQLHKERARHDVEASVAAQVSRELTVPLLVPVFPRPREEPVDWRHYTHALDRETLSISDGPLERIDLQLLKMVEDAKQYLAETPYSFSQKIMLNGFSASGNFADRFTVLHPDKVLSVTAGGLNGMPLLPLETAKDHTLRYHVGIADIQELIGKTVDLDSLNDVNQLLYMGENDTNDTIPYDDAWTDDELRQTALDVYGDDMIQERFPFSSDAYSKADVTAQFKIYEDAGHTPSPALSDIIEFHRKSMNGESVDEFGDQIGTNVAYNIDTQVPKVGDPLEFDASPSSNPQGDIQAYTWDFGDGTTASGKVVSHTFESAGEYTVTLEVVDSSGNSLSTSQTVTIQTTTTSTKTTAEQTTESVETPQSTETVTGSGTTKQTEAPGFGFGSAIGALGGVGMGYLLKRFRSKEER